MEPGSNRPIDYDDESSEIDPSFFDIELPNTTMPIRREEEMNEEKKRMIEQEREKEEKRRKKEVENNLMIVYDFVNWALERTYGVNRMLDGVIEVDKKYETMNGFFVCRMQVKNMQYYRIESPEKDDIQFVRLTEDLVIAKQRMLYLDEETKGREARDIKREGYDRVRFIEIYFKVTKEKMLMMMVTLRTDNGEEINYIPFGLMKEVRTENGLIKGYIMRDKHDIQRGRYDEGVLIDCRNKKITVRNDKYYITYEVEDMVIDIDMMKRMNMSAYMEVLLGEIGEERRMDEEEKQELEEEKEGEVVENTNKGRMIDLEVELDNEYERMIEEERFIPSEVCRLYNTIRKEIYFRRNRERSYPEVTYRFIMYRTKEHSNKCRLTIQLKRDTVRIVLEDKERAGAIKGGGKPLIYRYGDLYAKDGISYFKRAREFTMYKEILPIEDGITYEQVRVVFKGVTYTVVSIEIG